MSLDVGCHIYNSYIADGIWRILEQRAWARTFYLHSLEVLTHEAVNIPVEPPNDSLAIAFKGGWWYFEFYVISECSYI